MSEHEILPDGRTTEAPYETCPFCGGNAIRYAPGPEEPVPCQFLCVECGAIVHFQVLSTRQPVRDSDAATEKWNCRAKKEV